MIAYLRKFAVLPAPERGLLVEAAISLAAARLALWVFPFRIVRLLPKLRFPSRGLQPPAKLAWAIAATAPHIPHATCLARALAGQMLLSRRGMASTVRIGVAKAPAFEAHAWLEHDGVVLLGGAVLGRYTPLPIHL